MKTKEPKPLKVLGSDGRSTVEIYCNPWANNLIVRTTEVPHYRKNSQVGIEYMAARELFKAALGMLEEALQSTEQDILRQ